MSLKKVTSQLILGTDMVSAKGRSLTLLPHSWQPFSKCLKSEARYNLSRSTTKGTKSDSRQNKKVILLFSDNFPFFAEGVAAEQAE